MRTIIPLLVSVLVVSGCDAYRHVQQIREAKHEAGLQPQRLNKALQAIPYAAEFRQTFPSAAYDVYGSRHDGYYFGADVGIHLRYVLSLRVSFTTASDGVSVVGFGEPKFSLVEVSRIERLSDGRLYTHFSTSKELRFGASAWRSVLNAGGDFSAIGYTMTKNTPVELFREIRRNHP